MWADGVYVAERAVLKLPDIPGQRAVIAWKDGKETLLIESALDSEAQKLGWIIPLPAVPTVMEKAEPGGLKTLRFCTQPKNIIHNLKKQAITLTIVAAFVLLLIGTYLYQREQFALVVTAVLILIVIITMSLSTPRNTKLGVEASVNVSFGLKVEKTAQVGDYDVTVLSATKPEELDAWLAGNGFGPLPGAAKIVSEYIRDKWMFAAVKLARQESGTSIPHPIRLEFTSPRAVYPMKLTRLAQSSPQFELFVVANDRAKCRPLKTVFCDRFTENTRVIDSWHLGTKVPAFVGKDTKVIIGHPEICNLMWDGCVVTKFEGKLTPSQMTTDLQFSWRSYSPHKPRLFSFGAAYTVAFMVFVVLFSGGMAGMMIASRARLRQAAGRAAFLSRVLTILLVVSLATAGLIFASLPKVPADRYHVQHYSKGDRIPHFSAYYVAFLLQKNESLLQFNDTSVAEAVRRAYADCLKTDAGLPVINPILGTEVCVESTPGNFTIAREPGKLIIQFYDHFGCPMPFEFPHSYEITHPH